MSELDDAWKELIATALRRNVVVAVAEHRSRIEAALRPPTSETPPASPLPIGGSATSETPDPLPLRQTEWPFDLIHPTVPDPLPLDAERLERAYANAEATVRAARHGHEAFWVIFAREYAALAAARGSE